MESILSKRLKDPVIMKVEVIPVIEPGTDLFSGFRQPLAEEQTLTKEAEIEKQEPQKPEETVFLKCPVEINGKRVIRSYPANIGCPVCPKIISCGDGREFPAEQFNEETGLCEDLVFGQGEPCFKQEEQGGQGGQEEQGGQEKQSL